MLATTYLDRAHYVKTGALAQRIKALAGVAEELIATGYLTDDEVMAALTKEIRKMAREAGR